MVVCAIIYHNIYLNYEFIEIYWRSRGSLWKIYDSIKINLRSRGSLWNHNQDKNPINIKFMSG